MTTPERGGRFYDLPRISSRYLGHRHSGAAGPNHVMEEPAFLAELGSVDKLRVIDLGCGDATTGLQLLNAGCQSYLGVDSSASMVTASGESLRGTAGRVVRMDMEDFSAPPGTCDLVVSRLALHYVEDVESVLAACRDCLSPGGRLIFSVIHPLLSAYDSQSDGTRTSWVVDDYFSRGARDRRWMGGNVVWFHRTVEDYVGALLRAGFSLDSLRECEPAEARFGGEAEEFARRRRVPLFLLLSATRA
ncbi:class I SAM-dependent DNA methyltransferase [Nonomuraea sp. SBT364]|uniref:class I SAM-dependent DNA methyltransferase n=1 Tax=Nonomuraea sp. SBT364 TaxID=1580530 RepID=UPI0007C6E976|nr:class I SAM-dependent methyltransferase [Nonomuraea sp. SBT364]